MFDDLDPRSPTPLYEQIAAHVRRAVVSEEVVPGDSLPSVRQLAARLRVNPATVVQAYRDLEDDGLVTKRQGAGTFVSDVTEERRGAVREHQAERLVRQLLEEAGRLGIHRSELVGIFNREVGGSTP